MCSGVLQGPWYPAEECSSLLKSSYQLMRIPLGAGRKGLECVSLSELGRMLITMPVSARTNTHTHTLSFSCSLSLSLTHKCLHACSQSRPSRELQSLTHEQTGGGKMRKEGGCFQKRGLVLSSWFGTNWFQMKISAHKLEKALMLSCTSSPFQKTSSSSLSFLHSFFFSQLSFSPEH